MAPVPFDGTKRQMTKNLMSHDFGAEGKCYECDCRFGSLSSGYPCGDDVPRHLVKIESDEGERAMRGSMGALLPDTPSRSVSRHCWFDFGDSHTCMLPDDHLGLHQPTADSDIIIGLEDA